GFSLRAGKSRKLPAPDPRPVILANAGIHADLDLMRNYRKLERALKLRLDSRLRGNDGAEEQLATEITAPPFPILQRVLPFRLSGCNSSR
ncbi:hypothetical protein, partial [Halopseudomonas pelagia]|uniref:hypothetical protein n=1 Tax=Halopseudomonas pelagia TaxID=553151 RepID=UPI001F4738C1